MLFCYGEFPHPGDLGESRSAVRLIRRRAASLALLMEVCGDPCCGEEECSGMRTGECLGEGRGGVEGAPGKTKTPVAASPQMIRQRGVCVGAEGREPTG